MIFGQSNQDERQPSLFQRIGSFFNEGDPNAGSPIDPFANLTRAQRTMLGFSALRDAAASLEGRDSNFFAQSLGGFEQARERERLRTQGEMQNRVGALQALATLNEQMRYNQAFGLPTDPATDALRAALMEAAGLGSGAAPMAGGMPSMPTAGMPATRLPTGPAVMDASGAIVGDIGDEPLSPTAQAALAAGPDVAAPVPAPPAAPTGQNFDADRQVIFNEMRMRMAAGAGVADLQAQLDAINASEKELRDQAAAAEAAAAEAAAQARPTGTAAGIAIREADDMLLALGFDPETGDRVGQSQVSGPRGRLAVETGFGGFVAAGTPTADFMNNLQSLKDTVAIQRLLEIKAAGAGLGAIPQSQLEALARALGNLNASTSDDVLARNLRDVRRLYQGIVENSLRDSNDPTFRGLIADIAAPVRGPAAPAMSEGDEDILRRYLP
jgi:hypothetical protein